MSNLPPTAEIDPETLEDLTGQQMGYVQDVLSGKTLTEAYRANYDCSNMLPTTVHEAASRLRANSKVSAWISLGRRQCMARGTVTLEGHLAELESLKEESRATGNLGAAVKAEELRGKAAGVYLGDDQGRLAKVPAVQLIAIIRDGIGGVEGEEAAMKVAKRLGVTLLPRKPVLIEHEDGEIVDVG